MKKLIAVLALGILSGCAATPIPQDTLQTLAKHDIAFNKCYAAGLIDGNAAARGKNFIAETLSSRRHDHNQYIAYSAQVNKMNTPTAMWCNQLAASYQGYIEESQRNVQRAYDNRDRLNQQIQQQRTRQTSCTNIAGIVNCNTY